MTTYLVGTARIEDGDDPRPVVAQEFDPSHVCMVTTGPGACDATAWPVAIKVRPGVPRDELAAYLTFALGEIRRTPPAVA